MLVMAYGCSYELPHNITPLVETTSKIPNEYPEKVIPKFSVLAKRGEKISIHGDGTATRSYMHVDDLYIAFVHARLRRLTSFSIAGRRRRFITSACAKSRRSYPSHVCKLLDRDPETTVEHVSNWALNDRRHFIDCSKLLALGWRQEKSWDVCLAETVCWYSNKDLSAYWGELSHALRPHPRANVDGRR